MIDPRAESTLNLIGSDKPYADLKAHLQAQLGKRQTQQDASHKLATLVKGNLSYQELARQATHLSQAALRGARDNLHDQQVLKLS